MRDQFKAIYKYIYIKIKMKTHMSIKKVQGAHTKKEESKHGMKKIARM